MRKHIAWVVPVLLAVVAGGFFWVRVRPTPEGNGASIARAAERQRVSNAAIEQGQRVFRALPMRALESFTSPADVRAVLEKADVQRATAVDKERLPTLLDVASELVYWCFVSESADDYVSWRERAGYKYIGFERMAQVFRSDYLAETVLGSRPPQTAESSEVFPKVWRGVRKVRDGAGWPVAICDDAPGVLVCFGALTRTDPRGRKPHSGVLPVEVWRGMVGGSSPSWWTRGESVDALLRKYDQVRYAELALVMKTRTGDRYPIVLTFVWEEDAGRWRAEHLNRYNWPVEKMSPIAW